MEVRKIENEQALRLLSPGTVLYLTSYDRAIIQPGGALFWWGWSPKLITSREISALQRRIFWGKSSTESIIVQNKILQRWVFRRKECSKETGILQRWGFYRADYSVEKNLVSADLQSNTLTYRAESSGEPSVLKELSACEDSLKRIFLWYLWSEEHSLQIFGIIWEFSEENYG